MANVRLARWGCFLLPMACLILTACGVTVTNPAMPSSAAATGPAAGGHKNPIAAALDDFYHRSDLPFAHSSTSAVLLVDNVFQYTLLFINAPQFAADLTGEGWSIPPAAIADVGRRTLLGERFHPYRLPAFVRVVDLAAVPPGDVKQFPQRRPDAKCYVKLWAPGYTADGNQAVVRFAFGPAEQTANAIYLVEKKDGVWRVLHGKVSYYG